MRARSALDPVNTDARQTTHTSPYWPNIITCRVKLSPLLIPASALLCSDSTLRVAAVAARMVQGSGEVQAQVYSTTLPLHSESASIAASTFRPAAVARVSRASQGVGMMVP
jgi:hypothetical protein